MKANIIRELITEIIVISSLLLSFTQCKNNEIKLEKSKAPKDMIWIESKTFIQGAKDFDYFAKARGKPAHKVTVDAFFIDITEVTNK